MQCGLSGLLKFILNDNLEPIKTFNEIAQKILIEKTTACWPFITIRIVAVCIVAGGAINLFSFCCVVTIIVCCSYCRKKVDLLFLQLYYHAYLECMYYMVAMEFY